VEFDSEVIAKKKEKKQYYRFRRRHTLKKKLKKVTVWCFLLFFDYSFVSLIGQKNHSIFVQSIIRATFAYD
jgi:hypothetical protein